MTHRVNGAGFSGPDLQKYGQFRAKQSVAYGRFECVSPAPCCLSYTRVINKFCLFSDKLLDIGYSIPLLLPEFYPFIPASYRRNLQRLLALIREGFNDYRHTFITLLFIAVFSVLMNGCKTPPLVHQLSTAKAALDSAKAAQAETYAQAEFLAAREMLYTAESKIADQKNVPIFRRNYDLAETSLIKVEHNANNARMTSLAVQKQMQTDVLNRITELDTLIYETTEALETASRLKNTAGSFDSLESEIIAAENALNEAQSLFEKGDLIGARNKADSARARISKVPAGFKLSGKKMF